jgi:hypothetical protein
MSKWKERTEWSSLSVKELEGQIEVRAELIRSMVGSLYPRILEDECRELRVLLVERRQQASEHPQFPHDIAIKASGEELRDAYVKHLDRSGEDLYDVHLRRLAAEKPTSPWWRKVLGVPFLVVGYLVIAPALLAVVVCALGCIPGAIVAGIGYKIAGIPMPKSEEKADG